MESGKSSVASGQRTGTSELGLTELEGMVVDRMGQIRVIVMGCHRRMGSPLSPSDLEEVIQESSLSAWQHRASFRGDSDIDSWLYGIARLTILGHLRFSRRRRMAEFEILNESQHPEDPMPGPDELVDTGIRRVIDGGLDEIGTTVAAICRARALGEQSFVEISANLRVSEATVKARFYRSLPQLRRRLRGIWADGKN